MPALTPDSVARENVLGVGVSAINMDAAIRVINHWIDCGQRAYVCVTGVHGVMESQRNQALQDIHNRAGLVTPDGMPMAWLLKLGGHRDTDRVCGPELMPALFVASQARGDRHFLYGGTQQTLDLLQARLREVAPRAQVTGSYSPPFRAITPEEDAEIVHRINESGADIVWVGLSTPKQEFWMAEHRDRLRPAVLIGVGAAFDITAGIRTRAPKILRRTGLEWVYRLMQEPRRLWRRYFESNPRFFAMICMQKAGLLRPSLREH